METTKTMRVIPTGQVYRQMFDAEVQLVHALEGREADEVPEEVQPQYVAQRSDLLPVGIPLIRQHTSGPGMLTERQKTWTESLPYQHGIENPVLYKFYSEGKREVVPESQLASDEVRGLPDIVSPAMTGSNIIERIGKSRKKRHIEALEDMHQELGVISTEMEPRIVKIGEALMEKLLKNNEVVEAIIMRIDRDEDLVGYTRGELDDLWNEVVVQSVERSRWMDQADKSLEQVEQIRLGKIMKVFQKYYVILMKNAHLMLSNLQKALDVETQLINQTVLSNRRCYTDLHARLMLNDIEREKRLHTRWKDRLAEWNAMHIYSKIIQFRDYMESDDVVSPPGIRQILDNLQSEQSTLNKQRLDLMETLRELFPPASTKIAVYHWNQQITQLSKQMQNISDQYFNQLYAEYEQVCRRCLEQMECVMTELIDTEVCTHEEAQQIVNEQCLPRVGAQQAKFESELEVMNKALELNATEQAAHLKSLFKFCQGAAHVWDAHELGLAKQERALQEKLDECRQHHDAENQTAESHLDILLDQMRQDSTEKGLHDKLAKALLMLDNLKKGYEEFHGQQMAVVAEYPGMVQEELARYDHAVCSYFSVDRKHPDARSREKEEQMEHDKKDHASPSKPARKPKGGKNAVTAELEPKDSDFFWCVSHDRSTTVERTPRKVAEEPSPREACAEIYAKLKDLPMAVGDMMSTLRGTTFYVLMVAEDDLQLADKVSFDHAKRASQETETVSYTETGKQLKADGAMLASTEEQKSSGKSDEDGDADGTALIEKEEDAQTQVQTSIHSTYNMAEDRTTLAQDTESMRLELVERSVTKALDLPVELLLQLRQAIRLGFLNHMEGWLQQAIERSHNVVAAKTEELNSELDLRLHLHKPRASRTELDVRNVRAAEIVLHSERVERHIGGVSDALQQIRSSYVVMTQSHKDMTAQFKLDIQSLQKIFFNATKSARLVALSSRIQQEQDSYMENIRASLRSVRQQLDNTLQKLRQSNARFIKSFKVFSDGGNFCPEEIDVYKKQLVTMSTRIEKAEGSIMSDLEGIESKRLDQANKITADFQNKFKHHMVDLLFIEKVSRWLTNTQVKIKAEVAMSNSQARSLTLAIETLRRKVDACGKPSFDKETVSTSDLYAYLIELFTEYRNRSIYLNSLLEATQKMADTATPIDDAYLLPSQKRDSVAVDDVEYASDPKRDSSAAHVGFAAPASMIGTNALTTALNKSLKMQDDAAIPVIQNILTTQQTKLQIQQAEQEAQAAAKAGPVLVAEVSGPSGSYTPKSSRSGTATGTRLGSDRRQKSASSGTNADQKPHDSNGSLSWKTTSVASLVSNKDQQPKRPPDKFTIFRRVVKLEKRFYVFGEYEEEGETDYFLGRINFILRETLNGLLTSAELFYRQKRERPITRPQALQDTFDAFVETLTTKLQGYMKQAEGYQNQCLQEFRDQLQTFEHVMPEVPVLMVRELLKTELGLCRDQQTSLVQDFGTVSQQSQQEKVAHEGLLRPQLGHPQNADQLNELCDRENERSEQLLAAIEQQCLTLQDSLQQHAAQFVESLATKAEQILLQLDSCLTTEDVAVGFVEVVKFPASELIRRDKAGVPLEDQDEGEQLPRGSHVWQGLQRTEMIVGQASEEIEKTKSQTSVKDDVPPITASVTSAKTTLGHTACVEQRDRAYQEYKEYFESSLASIEVSRQQQKLTAEHYRQSWLAAVDRVKQLYAA